MSTVTEYKMNQDQIAREAYAKAGFDPLQVKSWIRYRFKAYGNDTRPIVWPPAGPYWVTGKGDGYDIIVAYIPKNVPLEKYWPGIDAGDINMKQEVCEVKFSERFPKPGYWPFD